MLMERVIIDPAFDQDKTISKAGYHSAQRSELRDKWDAAAIDWAKWEPTISAGLPNATAAMMDMAGIQPGMRVLDVACGAGDLTIQLAKRVGPTGSVVANDISPIMLILLQANVERAGLRNIGTLECAAEDLTEVDGSFDAVICRMGLELFPSPGSALEAIQRVLKPGGRFAALAMTNGVNNPTFSEPMAILRRHARKARPIAEKSKRFALGGEGVLESVMEESGLADVRTQTVLDWPRRLEPLDAMRMLQDAFGAFRGVVADLTAAEQAAAWMEVHDCLKRFERGGDLEKTLEVTIGAGARPNIATATTLPCASRL